MSWSSPFDVASTLVVNWEVLRFAMEGTCHMDVVNSVIVVSYPNNNSYARGIYVAPYNVVVFAIVV